MRRVQRGHDATHLVAAVLHGKAPPADEGVVVPLQGQARLVRGPKPARGENGSTE